MALHFMGGGGGVSDHTLLSNIGTNTHAQVDTALTRLANTSGTNTGDQVPTVYAISFTAIDWASAFKTGGLYTKTLGADTTFTFSNLAAGQFINVLLDNSGMWEITWPTVTWYTDTPSATTGGIFTFIYDGTTVHGSFVVAA